MVLRNITDEWLLVSPQSFWANLQVKRPSSGDESADQIAEDELANFVDPAADPQATSVSFGSKYLGPHEAVRITSVVPGGVSVDVYKDYYATAKWALAHAAAAWAIGKAESILTPRQLSIRDAVRNCASDLQVSRDDVASPPDLGDLVHSTILYGLDCITLLKTFAPNENENLAAAEVADFSKEVVKEIPSNVWEDILRGVAQLLHDR